MDPAPPDLQEQGAALYEETEATRAVLREEQHALMRQIRTSAGSEQFVKAVIQHTLLSRNCDWGQLLSSAPRALMCLGQCFVVASSPLAATLHLPEGMGLEYVLFHILNASVVLLTSSKGKVSTWKFNSLLPSWSRCIS
jgi:hypothetical protein